LIASSAWKIDIGLHSRASGPAGGDWFVGLNDEDCGV
jgi:hypothetical protein